MDTIRNDLHKVLQPNGLTLNEATLRDGNCGLDAALRGFAFVENPGDEMRSINESLAKRGRKRTIDLMREKLVAWLRANKDREILPGMTVEQFVSSDTGTHQYTSMDDYLQYMSVNDQWIDHVMLYALFRLLSGANRGVRWWHGFT